MRLQWDLGSKKACEGWMTAEIWALKLCFHSTLCSLFRGVVSKIYKFSNRFFIFGDLNFPGISTLQCATNPLPPHVNILAETRGGGAGRKFKDVSPWKIWGTTRGHFLAIENRIYIRGEFTRKNCKTAILLYCFHTAGVFHIFVLCNLLGPVISFYRKS